MGRVRAKEKRGKAVTKTRASQQAQQEDEYTRTPHSFVIHRGDVGRGVRQLVRDVRNVMSPFTATNLKPRRKNALKDYVAIAGPLNVTHLISFSRSELSLNMRVMRMPKGPTLTFNILEYSLCRDVISSIKRHNMDPKQFQHHPLLVMNGLAGDGRQFPLMATMFQNMFLPINVNQVKLSNIRRCVLMNYDKEDDTIEFRHYNIRTVPVGMSRGVKKLIKAKIPNMASYDDISEFVMRGGNLSESEGEMDGPHNEVTLPQSLPGRGNIKNAQSAIRLSEVGPRMKLRLVKIETELCGGEVLYHKFIERSKEELALAERKRAERKRQKEVRKRLQQENVEKKDEQKEEMKRKSLAGMKKKSGDDSDKEVEEDDDAEYYKAEVGVEPEADLLLKRAKKRRSDGDGSAPWRDFKKRKSEDTKHDGGDKGFRGRGRGRGGLGRGRGDGSSSRGGSRGGFGERGRGSQGRGFSRGGRGDRGSRGRGFSGSRGGSRGGSGDRGSRGRGFGSSRGGRGGSSFRGGFVDRDGRSRGGSLSRGGRGGPSRGGRGGRGGPGGRGGFSNRLAFNRDGGRGRPGGKDFKKKR